MIIKEIQKSEKDQYNSVVSHIMQSYEWGEFKETTGVKVIRLGIFNDQNILQKGLQLTLHPIPKTKFSVGYLPRGTVIDKEILNAFEKIGKENNCIFIKIEPDISVNTPDAQNIEELKSQGKLKESPKSILSSHNFILDLTPSEEELLAKMHPKTRYNIKIAVKNGVVVKEETNEKGLKTFINLQTETAKRQKFYIHPDSYYKSVFNTLVPIQMAKILIAYFDNQPIVAWFLLRFKDNFYYTYGGSTEKHRNVMGSNLIMWEAIRLGKTLSCKTFDMWGAAPPDAKPSHPWYGFTNFKSGYAPKRVEYVGTFDYITNPTLYTAFLYIDKIRWAILNLLAKIH